MGKYLSATILLSLFVQILFADAPPSLANVRYKKNVMPPDCRYQTSDPLWTRPEDSEWSRDGSGERSGLVNLYIHGSLEKITDALTAHGWVEPAINKFSDDGKYLAFAGLDGDIHLLRGFLRRPQFLNRLLKKLNKKINRTIITMPVSNEYFCTRIQVAAFESDNHVLRGRHHLRVFETGKIDQQKNKVYAVAANEDIGIKFAAKKSVLTHKIEPNTDTERDLVAHILTMEGAKEELPIPYTLSPAPRDGATSKDRQALEFYMD